MSLIQSKQTRISYPSDALNNPLASENLCTSIRSWFDSAGGNLRLRASALARVAALNHSRSFSMSSRATLPSEVSTPQQVDQVNYLSARRADLEERNHICTGFHVFATEKDIRQGQQDSRHCLARSKRESCDCDRFWSSMGLVFCWMREWRLACCWVRASLDQRTITMFSQ